MTDELIDNVIYLIDSKKGDLGRLNYILGALQEGKELYNSDRKYLDSLISTYIGTSRKRFTDRSSDELKTELTRVKDRLAKFEKRGYKKPIGRKAVFFFITFFFGWHAITTLVGIKFLQDMQNINQYILPLYQLNNIIPAQYLNYMQMINLSIPKIVVLVWGAMLLTWIILGFVYLVKYIRSRYNPALP